MSRSPQDKAQGKRGKARVQWFLEVPRERYVLRGRRALLEYLLCAGEGTIDDARDLVDLPRAFDPRLFGAVPGELVRAGIVRRVGYTPSCRPTAHGRPVAIWVVAARAAAERWLADHSDVSFPTSPTNTTGTAAVTAAPLMEAERDDSKITF